MQAEWRDAFGAYLVEVRSRTGSLRTVDTYGKVLRRFVTDVRDPAAVTPHVVHAFAYGIGASGRTPSASTVIVRLAALRGFYDYARRMGLVDRNPADSASVKRPRLAPPTPKGLSIEEIRTLLEVIPDKPSGIRDRAIIVTCVLTGLRRAEVMGLRVRDLSQDGERVFFQVRAKGGVQRHRELPLPAYAAILASLKAAGTPIETLSEDSLLFPVSVQAFYSNLRRYGAKARLTHLTPHVLRHSAAKLRRSTGASIEDVSVLLGHRSIATTATYLARLEGEQDAGWKAAAAALGVA